MALGPHALKQEYTQIMLLGPKTREKPLILFSRKGIQKFHQKLHAYMCVDLGWE